MKFQGLVTSFEGQPLSQASAAIVSLDGKRSEGKVDAGALVIEADPGPVWGLEIDGKPVIAIVASANKDRVELGEIALVPSGMAWPVFHAKGGSVFGVPRAALGLGTTKPTDPAVAPAPSVKSGATFGTLLGSAAQQLNKAAVARTGLKLRGASVTVKGLPTTSGDAIGLEFPTADIVGAGAGLSEVS
ncbi:MAG TPA: hypothetical protein VMG12_00220, partial [Polyangiaceae bacterium]|nr:hypothetical protein [Polyangiaceae bacterium]